MRIAAALILVASCASPDVADREQRIITALAEDNYLWAVRDRARTSLKLIKMQRGPYEWLRGTANLYWRELMDPGGVRAQTAFGDSMSSRVLLVGDPHPENLGTFRAADGTMFVDWNDLDGSGYGPFTGDLRRLGAGLAIGAEDPTISEDLVRRAVTGYTAQIASLATGTRAAPLVAGRYPLLDDELAKAKSRGDTNYALDEAAPVVAGARAMAFVDLEPVAADGVIEDRLQPVSIEVADWIDRAVAQWSLGRTDTGAIKLRGRRIGSGVASYAAYRFNVVLEGPSAALDDDLLIELKETREGVIVRGVPQLTAAEWSSPAARVVDTQRRLHARSDGDGLLGSALVGGLSLKIRDREAYQRGLDRGDLADLAAGGASDRAELLALAEVYGGLLARAHGQAITADGIVGWTVIAPLIAGRETAFGDEITAHALAEVAQVVADHALMMDRDLIELIVPEVAP